MSPAEVLNSTSLFAKVLDPAEIETLASGLKLADFPRGAVLMRQGEEGATMFILLQGAVEVVIHAPGGPKNVAVLGPGEIVGEMSLMTGCYRTATVSVTKALTALEIPKDALRSLVSAKPDLIRRFAEIIEQRSAELKMIRNEASRAGKDRISVENMMRAFYMS